MPSCGDVKITLDFVAFQTSKNATRIRTFSSTQLRGFRKLLPTLSHVSENVSHMLVLLLCLHSIRILLVQQLVFWLVPSPSLIQLVGPELPIRLVFRQQLSCQNPVTCRILNIDM